MFADPLAAPEAFQERLAPSRPHSPAMAAADVDERETPLQHVNRYARNYETRLAATTAAAPRPKNVNLGLDVSDVWGYGFFNDSPYDVIYNSSPSTPTTAPGERATPPITSSRASVYFGAPDSYFPPSGISTPRRPVSIPSAPNTAIYSVATPRRVQTETLSSKLNTPTNGSPAPSTIAKRTSSSAENGDVTESIVSGNDSSRPPSPSGTSNSTANQTFDTTITATTNATTVTKNNTINDVNVPGSDASRVSVTHPAQPPSTTTFPTIKAKSSNSATNASQTSITSSASKLFKSPKKQQQRKESHSKLKSTTPDKKSQRDAKKLEKAEKEEAAKKAKDQKLKADREKDARLKSLKHANNNNTNSSVSTRSSTTSNTSNGAVSNNSNNSKARKRRTIVDGFINSSRSISTSLAKFSANNNSDNSRNANNKPVRNGASAVTKPAATVPAKAPTADKSAEIAKPSNPPVPVKTTDNRNNSNSSNSNINNNAPKLSLITQNGSINRSESHESVPMLSPDGEIQFVKHRITSSVSSADTSNGNMLTLNCKSLPPPPTSARTNDSQDSSSMLTSPALTASPSSDDGPSTFFTEKLPSSTIEWGDATAQKKQPLGTAPTARLINSPPNKQQDRNSRTFSGLFSRSDSNNKMNSTKSSPKASPVVLPAANLPSKVISSSPLTQPAYNANTANKVNNVNNNNNNNNNTSGNKNGYLSSIREKLKPLGKTGPAKTRTPVTRQDIVRPPPAPISAQ